MSQLRQEFEVCLGYPHNFDKDQCGGYIEQYVQAMWVGWKLAYNKYHRDVKVELPYCYHIDGNGYSYDKDDMLGALDNAGVKY